MSLFKTQVAPLIIMDEVEVRKAFTGKLVDHYKAKERDLPEFLRYSSVNCPSGFDFLLESSCVVVQKVNNCCRTSKFDIMNGHGERFLEVAPVSCTCGFVMSGTKNRQQILYTNRPFFLLPCCDDGMRVEAPQGNLLGFVTLQVDVKCCNGCVCEWECCKCDGCKGDCCKDCCKWDCCKGGCCKGECCRCQNCCSCLCLKCSGVITKPSLFVLDPMREVMMTINMEVRVTCPYCVGCCVGKCGCSIGCVPCAKCGKCGGEDVVYTLRAQDAELIGAGTVIGEIRRKYPGCCCPDPPRYEITFPDDLEIRMKVILTSAALLMEKLGY